MSEYYNIKRAYENEASTREDILKLYLAVEDKNQPFDGEGKSTLLHLAAGFADHEAIALLLEHGAKATAVNEYGYTTLHSLCDAAHSSKPIAYNDIYNATVALLNAKASTLRKNESGKTCAHVAAERGIDAMIQALVDSNAKINLTDDYGYTVLHFACKGVKSPIDTVKYDVAKVAQSKKSLDESKNSNSEAWVKVYAKHYEDDLARLEKTEKHIERYFNVVKTLLDYGFDPEQKDNSGKTPLDYAVASNAKKIAALLKGEYDENNPDSLAVGGMNVFQAIEKGDLEALKAIIASGINVEEHLDIEHHELNGMTPLAAACVHMNVEAVQLLLDAGADPNFKSGEHGYTAVYQLIHHGSSNVNSRTYESKAIQQIAKRMVNAGLDINDRVDDDSNTALIEACRISSSARINSNSFDAVLLETIIDLGADVNAANKNGQTPLMMLAKKDLDTESFFITLLEIGAKTDVADKDGNTPAMYAAGSYPQSAAKTYVELMAEFGDLKLDAVNNNGKTALDIAQEKDYETVVKLLLTL